VELVFIDVDSPVLVEDSRRLLVGEDDSIREVLVTSPGEVVRGDSSTLLEDEDIGTEVKLLEIAIYEVLDVELDEASNGVVTQVTIEEVRVSVVMSRDGVDMAGNTTELGLAGERLQFGTPLSFAFLKEYEDTTTYLS